MTVLDMQAKVSTADTFVTEQKGQRNQTGWQFKFKLSVDRLQ